MKRPWKEGPEAAAIEIDGQRLLVKAVGNGQIYVEAPNVVVRNIAYRATLHFLLHEGRWTNYYDVPGRSGSFKASRQGSFQDPSPAANRSIADLMERAVEKFVEDRPDLLVAGERAGINNDIHRIDESIEKVSAQLNELVAERQALLARERELPEAEEPGIAGMRP